MPLESKRSIAQEMRSQPLDQLANFRPWGDYEFCDRVPYWRYNKRRTLAKVLTNAQSSLDVDVAGAFVLHPDGYIRESAVQFLSRSALPSRVAYLLVAANDWVPEVRNRAAVALQQSCTNENAEGFFESLPLIARLLQCKRADHRPLVSTIIESVFLNRIDEMLDRASQFQDQRVSRNLARFALHMTDVDIAKLSSRLFQSTDPVLRTLVIRQCRINGVKDVRSELAELLNDPNTHVRREALMALAQADTEASLGLYRTALRDSSWVIRELAQTVLRKRGDEQLAERYARWLDEEPNCRSTLFGLSEVANAAHFQRLASYLEHPWPRHRFAAVRGLTRIGGYESVSVLLPYLDDPNPNVVEAVADHLAAHTHDVDLNGLITTCDATTSVAKIRALVEIAKARGKWTCLPYFIRISRKCHDADQCMTLEATERLFRRSCFTTPSPCESAAIVAELQQPDGACEDLVDLIRQEFEYWAVHSSGITDDRRP